MKFILHVQSQLDGHTTAQIHLNDHQKSHIHTAYTNVLCTQRSFNRLYMHVYKLFWSTSNRFL